MNFPKSNLKSTRTRGVTLIELLVVISILTVLTAIMIPRLRVINKDRNIREASRLVASKLTRVVTRATNEGRAGLIIERNPNFVDGAGIAFAGTILYEMRKLPPFTGDDSNAGANVEGGGFDDPMNPVPLVVSIPTPLEHRAAPNNLIKPGDHMRLNNSSVIYEITIVGAPTAGRINLTLSLALNAGFGEVRPRPATAIGIPFVIYRQPRKLESSRVDLPDGYYIDLRMSGPLVGTASVFDVVGSDEVRFAFDQNGVMDRWGIFAGGALMGGVGMADVPQDALYLYVSEFDPDPTPVPTDVLQSNAAMWVTMDKSTGSVNVAYNNPPSTALTAVQQIYTARGFGATRRSANQ